MEVCPYVGETHLDTSLWEFLSPSRVNGDAPVNSSNIRIPKLHQSTAYRQEGRNYHYYHTCHALSLINQNLVNLTKSCQQTYSDSNCFFFYKGQKVFLLPFESKMSVFVVHYQHKNSQPNYLLVLTVENLFYK